MRVRKTQELLEQEDAIMEVLLRDFRNEYKREPHFAEKLGLSSECRRIRREQGNPKTNKKNDNG